MLTRPLTPRAAAPGRPTGDARDTHNLFHRGQGCWVSPRDTSRGDRWEAEIPPYGFPDPLGGDPEGVASPATAGRTLAVQTPEMFPARVRARLATVAAWAFLTACEAFGGVRA